MKQDNGWIEQELEKSARKLDNVAVKSPEFRNIREMVDRQQAAMRRSQRIQLALFAAVAAALVSALILCMGRFEAFFLVLQGSAFGIAAISLIVSFAIKPREGLR